MADDYRKAIPERKRVKHTGRGKDHSFLRLPHFLLQSKEFAALSAVAVKLLLDMAKLYRGSNNGNLSMAWSRLSEEGWSSEATMRRARDELLQSGFLLCTRHGNRKRCGLYAISWEPIDRCEGKFLEMASEHAASHLWRNPCTRHGSKEPSKEATRASIYTHDGCK